MKSKSNEKVKERCCGSCRYHNMYEYPDQIFCFVKFQKRDNPVVSTLDCCDQWESKLQECYCLDETLKKHAKGTRQ